MPRREDMCGEQARELVRVYPISEPIRELTYIAYRNDFAC